MKQTTQPVASIGVKNARYIIQRKDKLAYLATCV